MPQLSRIRQAIYDSFIARKVTTQQYADELGWDRGNTSKRLRGDRPVDLEQAEAMADKVGLELVALPKELAAPAVAAAVAAAKPPRAGKVSTQQRGQRRDVARGARKRGGRAA